MRLSNPFRNRPRSALVFGSGPAGIFAAAGFADAGWNVKIYSKRRRSELFGAQYLLAPIPGLTEVKTFVSYTLNGTWVTSTEKVYGIGEMPEVDWQSYVDGRQHAWDIRAAYRDGLERFSDSIVNVDIDQKVLQSEIGNPSLSKTFGAVVSTIPAQTLCAQPDRHAFWGTELWASGDAPERDLWCPISVPPDTVVIDGTWERAWYRASNVFGHSTCEWPFDRKPPIQNLAQVTRPVATTCDCWPQITRAGRYGLWSRKAFSHHAYGTAKALTER